MDDIRIMIHILLVDNDIAFASVIKKMLDERSNGVRFTFDRSIGLKSNSSYDVFILDHSTIGTENLLQTIKQINKSNSESRVIVVGCHLDGHLLKQLMKLGIRSFVDKNDQDIEPIFDEIKEEAEAKYRVLKIKDGLNRLAAAKVTLNQALQSFG